MIDLVFGDDFEVIKFSFTVLEVSLVPNNIVVVQALKLEGVIW